MQSQTTLIEAVSRLIESEEETNRAAAFG